MNKYFQLKRAILFSCLFLLNDLSVQAQCPVNASASALTIYCGEGVDLIATGTPGFYIFDNDFNTGTVGTGWSATSTAMYTNPCGPGPGGSTDPHMWMGMSSAAPRNATTNAYDLSTGGTICFHMRYAVQGACGLVACDCEGPDLPDEGVHLQYSITGGASWVDIQYWDPMGGTDPTMTTWNYYCVAIPPAAMTTSTMIRWAQTTSSNAESDHWGLDNVTIATNDPNFDYDWTHDGLPPAPTSFTPTVYPTTTTTYTVNYSDGVSSCTDDVTVTVLAPTVSVTATPINICPGNSSQLVANSSLVATPPSSCGINTFAGCPANSDAGEPQIGSGTIVNAYNSGTENVFGDFGSTGAVRTQLIYRASELTAAGFSAGQITNMQFNIAAIQTNSGAPPSSKSYANFTIQIGCTSSSAFASSSAWFSGLTTVYPSATVNVTPGWNTFYFANSYNWNGTSNIVVQICWNNGSGGGNTCAKTFDHASGFNSLLSASTNTAGAGSFTCTSTNFQTLSTQRPNTRFGTCVPRDIDLLYAWAPSGSLSNSTIYNPSATPSATTTYTVTVTEDGAPAACGTTATVTVNVVTFNMTAVNGSRCGPGTVLLSTTGCSGTVNWYTAASGGSSIATGASFTTPSISSTTTYYASCTQFGCEGPRIPVVATVNPVPSSSFSISPASVCAGVNTTITYTGTVMAGAAYSWNFAGATIVSGSGQGPYTVNWPSPTGGTYNVTLSVTSAAGCTSTLTTQTATVSPGPDLSITPPAASYCAPGSVNLTGSAVMNPATYNTSGTNPADFTIPDNGVTSAWTGTGGSFVNSPILISGLNPSAWNLSSICLDITHGRDSDVIVYLVNPCGASIRLIQNAGGTGANFSTTCFTPAASNVIGSAGFNTAPFNGTYAPQAGTAAWTAFLACASPNGTWELLVGDAAGGVSFPLNTGSLINWSINFTSDNYITSYSWSPATNLSSTTTASTIANPSATTTYSLTVMDALGCPATEPVTVTVSSGGAADFSYAGTPYCATGTDPSPTLAAGASAGTFSSTAGLVFISTSTGQVDLSASTPGTYTVTNTLPASAGCPPASATSAITINPAPVATFSYTGSPYCSSGADPSPAFSGGGTAGTFSSTAGLVFVSTSTGQVDLSATTPGTYTVTNTIAASGGCAAVSATATIIINAAPSAAFSYAGSPYCTTGANPSPTLDPGASAGTFSSTAGLIFVSSSTGTINLSASTAGTYTVTNTIAASGGCPATSAPATITISNPPAADFSYTASPYCQSGTDPSPAFSGGGTAGTFSSAAGLVFVSTATGQVDLSASTVGTYTVTNTVSGGACPSVSSTATITITAAPDGSFSYTSSPYCQNAADPSATLAPGASAGTFSSAAGLIFLNTSTGQIDLSASTAGTYTVTNTIPASGGCAAVIATSDITVSPVESAAFSYSSSTFCSTGTDPTPVITGASGGLFTSSPAGLSLNATTGTITLSGSTLNTYSVTYTTTGACPGSSSINVTITNAPSADFSYAASPYCASGADPSPTFIGGGTAGTFSSAAGLVFVSTATGEVDLSASTPGTYTVTNSIPASGGCSAASSTATITIDPAPAATFSYAASPYCSTGSDPSPSFTGGGIAGTFSSTAGLVFVSTSSGEIDLSASTAGTYTVTNTVPGSGSCSATSATASITITAPQSAAFSYAGSPYCQNAADPLPALAAGASAGVFSSSPGLVFLNTSTGEIDLSASATGNYTVTNTIAASGGCPAVSSTASVTINPVQNAGFSYSSGSYCQTGSNPVPVITGTSGGTFSATPAGLSFVSTSTGEIDLAGSSANTYTITYTTPGPCGVSSLVNVDIISPPSATFSYAGTPYCSNGTDPFPTLAAGAAAGTFSSTAGLVFISSGTGEVDLSASTSGTYTVVNTIPASGGCAAVTANATITIDLSPQADFSYSGSPYCQGGSNPAPVLSAGSSAGTFSSTAGLVFISTSTGEIDLAASTPGTYTVSNTIPASGACAAVTVSSTLVINPSDDASFSYSASTFCQSGTNSVPVITGTTGGIFSSGPGLVFVSSTTGEVDLAASTLNTYTITYTTTGICPDAATFSITITNAPSASFSYTGSPYCSSAADPAPVFSGGGTAGTFSASSSGLVFISTSTGEIDLSASTPGSYTVTNTIPASGSCAAATATSPVTINGPDDASFSYASATFCQSGANPIPIIFGISGGSFSSTTGLVFVSTTTGEIDLAASTVNTYTITYTTPGPCVNSSTMNITITNSPEASFIYSGSPYCAGGADPAPTFTGGGTAGTFSATPSGLVFISTATGEVNLSASTAGTYMVTNSIAASGGCPSSTDSASITINPAPNAGFSYSGSPFCAGGSNPFPAADPGASLGTFSSSPSGLTFVSATTGEIDLSASSPGTYTITNTLAASGGCPSVSATFNITISSGPSAAFSYSASPYCAGGSNPSPVLGPGAAAGTFSASPSGLVFVSTSTGEVDLSASSTGTYTVTNTLAASGGCPASSATANITIDPAPDASFSYSGSPYCQTGSDPAPVFSGTATAGTFSASPSGLVFVSTSTGEIDLSASAAGTYTITNTIAASGGCPAVTASFSITISPLQNASFSYASSGFCQSGTDPSPVISGVSGGTFSSTPAGLSINTSTGVIDLSASGLSTYTVTYTTPGPCSNSSTVSVTISTSPAATASGTSVCSGSAINLSSGGGTSYSWAGPAGYSSASQNPSIPAAGPAQSGTYTVTVSNGGCTDTAQVFINVIATPNVSTSDDVIIMAGSSADLTASGASNYSWSNASSLSCSSCPDPVASPLETTTYCVISSNGSCWDSSCVTVEVIYDCSINKELGIPNAFSPNEDGVNDLFSMMGWEYCMREFYMAIYDRWGEKVYETVDASFTWDGTFRGKKLDPAVFVYFLQAVSVNGQVIERKGNITMLR